MKLGDLRVKKDTSGKSTALYCIDPHPVLTNQVFHGMKLWSESHNGEDVRVCLHKTLDDLMHNMIVYQKSGIYRKPHKEVHEEVCHIVKGKLLMVIFDAQGHIIQKIEISQSSPIFRTEPQSWHVSIPLTRYVIFHEIRIGPYTRGNVEYASWAPTSNKEGLVYYQKIIQT